MDKSVSKSVENALQNLYGRLSSEEIIPEGELIERFLEELKDLNEKYKKHEILKRWLAIYKKLDSNPLGEWGVAHSSNVRAKGMRDYAYLAIKRHGSPMHFKEVAEEIQNLIVRCCNMCLFAKEILYFFSNFLEVHWGSMTLNSEICIVANALCANIWTR